MAAPVEITSVMLAAQAGALETVRELVGRGADVNATDAQGVTPLEHAVRSGHTQVVQFLREHGANDSSELVRRYISHHMLVAAPPVTRGVPPPPPPPPPAAPPRNSLKPEVTALVGLAEDAPGTPPGGNIRSSMRRNASFVSPPPEIYLNRTVISTPSGELSLEDLFHEVDANGDRRISAMHELPVALTIMGLYWEEQLGVALLTDRTGVDTLETALAERCEEWWGTGSKESAPPTPPPVAAPAPMLGSSHSMSLNDAIDVDSDADADDGGSSDDEARPMSRGSDVACDTARSTTNFGNGAPAAAAAPPPRLDSDKTVVLRSPAVTDPRSLNRRMSSSGPMEDRFIDWTTFCSIVALLQAAGAYKEVIRRLLRERAAAAAAHLAPPQPPSNTRMTRAPIIRTSSNDSTESATGPADRESPSRRRSRSDMDTRAPAPPLPLHSVTSPLTAATAAPKKTSVPPLFPGRGHMLPMPEEGSDDDHHGAIHGGGSDTARSVDVGSLSRRHGSESARHVRSAARAGRNTTHAALRRAQTESHDSSIHTEARTAGRASQGAVSMSTSNVVAAAASQKSAPTEEKDKKAQAIERMTTLLKGRAFMTGTSSLPVGARVPLGGLHSVSGTRRTPTSLASGFFPADGRPSAAAAPVDGVLTRPDGSPVRLKRRSSNEVLLRGVTAERLNPSEAELVAAQDAIAAASDAVTGYSTSRRASEAAPVSARKRRLTTASIETGAMAGLISLASAAGPASAPARHSESFIMPNVSPVAAADVKRRTPTGSRAGLPPTSPSAIMGAKFRHQSLRKLTTSPASAAHADLGVEAALLSNGTRPGSSTSADVLSRALAESRFSFDSSHTSPSASAPLSARSRGDSQHESSRDSGGTPPVRAAPTRLTPSRDEADELPKADVTKDGVQLAPAVGSAAVLASGDGSATAAEVTTDEEVPLEAHNSAGKMTMISEGPDGSQSSGSAVEDMFPPPPPHEVFLGGACNPTTWRRTTAMPFLDAAGITFYNPQVDEWRPELVVQEAKAKDEADAVFFVVGPETRAIASMIEVAELISSGRPVVLVLQDVPKDAVLNGHALHPDEVKDLNRGRAYLANVADRHGITVYQSIEAALREVVSTIHVRRAERAAAFMAALQTDGSPRDSVGMNESSRELMASAESAREAEEEDEDARARSPAGSDDDGVTELEQLIADPSQEAPVKPVAVPDIADARHGASSDTLLLMAGHHQARSSVMSALSEVSSA